jgi:hypothetical protein
VAESSLEIDVIRAVREIVNHPRGGKLEVYVNRTVNLGERVYKVLPSLFGTNERRGTIQTADDD